MSSFKELRIWNEAIALTSDIYKLTTNDKFKNDFGLIDQIRRSSVSIASNIAEVQEPDYNKKRINFLNIARGSTAEVITQLIIANQVGYITKLELSTYEENATKILASIKKFITIISKDK